MIWNKKTSHSFYLFFLAAILVLFACTSRQSESVSVNDSQISYPPKNKEDISASISFCRYLDSKSFEMEGEGTVFTIMNGGWVQALVNIENRFEKINKDLIFHFDWIAPDGESVYIKRLDLLRNDSATWLNSSISISPETRNAGIYKLRIYYFRELIAEKSFELLPPFYAEALDLNEMSSQITLCSKVDKKTGERLGVDSVFTALNKSSIRAYFDFDRSIFGERELLFRFNWMKADGNAFYRKRIDLAPGDTASFIYSAISIAPEKRDTGNYKLLVYLFNELIAEKSFIIKEETKIIPIYPNQINASIVLYSKKNKKTGEFLGAGNQFEINSKAKVRAFVKIKNRAKFKNKNLDFTLEWLGPDGKSFYQKDITIKKNDPIAELSSAISITPDKRTSGNYKFRLLLNRNVVSERRFILTK